MRISYLAAFSLVILVICLMIAPAEKTDISQNEIVSSGLSLETYYIQDADVNITDCMNLTTPNYLYELNKSISGNQSYGSCVDIQADNVTVDCMGYTITGDNLTNIYGIYTYGYDNITIKGCNITGYDDGIHLERTIKSTIVNNTLYNNSIGTLHGNGAYILGSNITITNNTCYANAYMGIRFLSNLGSFLNNNSFVTFNNLSYNAVFGIEFNGNESLISFNMAHGNGDSGIGIFGDNNTISNNVASDCHDAIFQTTGGGNNNLFKNNTLYSSNHGFYTSGNNTTYINNTVYDNFQGFLIFDNNANITSNIIKNNTHGIYSRYASGYGVNNTIYNNTFFNNTQDGIYIGTGADYHEVYNNTIFNTTQNAIQSLSSSNTFYENIIYNNSNGFLFVGSSNNILYDNTVENNSYGVYTQSNSDASNILSNIFCLNTNQDLYFTSDSNSNSGNNTCDSIQDDDSNTVSCLESCGTAAVSPLTTTPTIDPATVYTTGDLYCNSTLTDTAQSTLIAYWTWYKNDVVNLTGIKYSILNNTNTNITVLLASNTTKLDNWTCEVTPSDGMDNGTAENSSIVMIQNSIPTITVYEPINKTYNTTSIELNVSANEPIDTWWYSLNSGTNTSFTPNTTITGVEGQNNITIWANDSVNNNQSSTVYFTVDTTIPGVIINDPQSITYSSTSITLDTTVTDATSTNCWYSLDSWITNTSYDCATSSITAQEGTNIINVAANDSAGNINITESVIFTVDLPEPSRGGGGSGSGISPTGTNYTINMDINKTFELDMKVNDNLLFILNGENHTANLVSLSSDSVVFDITSFTERVSVDVGQTKTVDVNQNGTNDLEITLLKNEFAEATLRFKKIIYKSEVVQPEQPTVQSPEVVPEEPIGEPKEEVVAPIGEFDATQVTIMISAILIASIVVLAIIFYRVRNPPMPKENQDLLLQ